MRLVLPLLLLLWPAVSAHDILIYINVIGSSHISFGNALIDTLTDAGHNVDVLAVQLNSVARVDISPRVRHLLKVPFPELSPWNRAVHFQSPFTSVESWNPFKSAWPFFYEANIQMCKVVLESSAVRAHMSSHRYSVLLLGAYEFCPYALAHGLAPSTPFASYAATPAMQVQLASAGVPLLPLFENSILDSRFGHDRSRFVERLFDTAHAWYEQFAYERGADNYNLLFREVFGADFPDVRAIAANTSVDFVNTHPLIDEQRPTSSRFRSIGGIALAAPKPLDNATEKAVVSAKKGVVLFSFGTQVPSEKYPVDVLQSFLAAFKRFPDHVFMWKFNSSIPLDADNVLNVDWMRQTDLLYSERVVGFITHGGLNSLTETAFAGVPVVVIPLFADQSHNAWRASQLGIGVAIKKTELTADRIYKALTSILYDKSYRERSLELAQMLRESPDNARRTLLENVDFVAKFKSLHEHHRSAGAEVSFLVLLGLDVHLAFLASIAVVLFLTFRISLMLVPVRLLRK